jgi:hypothetical protein
MDMHHDAGMGASCIGPLVAGCGDSSGKETWVAAGNASTAYPPCRALSASTKVRNSFGDVRIL